MKRHLGLVSAQGDDGRVYTLYIYTNDAPARPGTHPYAPVESIIELATSDGQLVRWRAKGRYEVVATGVRLRSYAPDAP